MPEEKAFLWLFRAKTHWKEPVLFLASSMEQTGGTSVPVASGELTRLSCGSRLPGLAQCCCARAYTEHQAAGAKGREGAEGLPTVPAAPRFTHKLPSLIPTTHLLSAQHCSWKTETIEKQLRTQFLPTKSFQSDRGDPGPPGDTGLRTYLKQLVFKCKMR